MISGSVNTQLEIVILLSIQDGAGNIFQLETMLDTGFTGSLTLPPSVISALGLPWHSRGDAILADGSIHQLEVYLATVIWDGVPKQTLVQAIDNVPLLGMSLLVDHDLRVRVQIGGAAEIEVVP